MGRDETTHDGSDYTTTTVMIMMKLLQLSLLLN